MPTEVFFCLFQFFEDFEAFLPVPAIVIEEAFFNQVFDVANGNKRDYGAFVVRFEQATGVEYGAYPIEFLEVALVVAENDKSVSVRFK